MEEDKICVSCGKNEADENSMICKDCKEKIKK